MAGRKRISALLTSSDVRASATCIPRLASGVLALRAMHPQSSARQRPPCRCHVERDTCAQHIRALGPELPKPSSLNRAQRRRRVQVGARHGLGGRPRQKSRDVHGKAVVVKECSQGRLVELRLTYDALAQLHGPAAADCGSAPSLAARGEVDVVLRMGGREGQRRFGNACTTMLWLRAS